MTFTNSLPVQGNRRFPTSCGEVYLCEQCTSISEFVRTFHVSWTLANTLFISIAAEVGTCKTIPINLQLYLAGHMAKQIISHCAIWLVLPAAQQCPCVPRRSFLLQTENYKNIWHIYKVIKEKLTVTKRYTFSPLSTRLACSTACSL